MKGMLGLAGDFLDRLANPVHGQDTNEIYAMRLAELVERDREMIGELARLRLEGEDVDLLTPEAWFWYVGWTRSAGAPRPDALLDALYGRARDMLLRFRVLEWVVTDFELNQNFETSPERPYTLDSFPDAWLGGRLRATLGAGQPEERYRASEELVLMLIQLGTPSSVEAARTLLGHREEPGPRLREAVTRLLGALPTQTGEDRELRDAWLRRLGL